jgi:CRP-like cAMP-binding protein
MPDPRGAILAPTMRKLGMRFPFSPDDRTAFLALPTLVRRLGFASYIVREADIAQSCGVLLSGFAYRHKIVRDGARQIVSLQVPGDMVDLHNSFLGIADHNVQMLTSGEVALIPAQTVKDICLFSPGHRAGHAARHPR